MHYLKLQNLLTVLGVFFLLMSTPGCFKPVSDPTKFYIIRPNPDKCCQYSDANYNSYLEPLVVGVYRVRLPGYLDNTKLSYIKCPNQIVYSEFCRWAEPLDENIQRVIGQDICQDISIARVSYFPWGKKDNRQLEVRVQFLDLLVDRPANRLLVRVEWEISSPDRTKIYAQKASCFEECIGECYEPGLAVDAMNRAIAKLSSQISSELKNVINENSKEVFPKNSNNTTTTERTITTEKASA